MELLDQADLDVKILEVKDLAEHRKGFVVERPQNFSYQPGQYMLIELVEDYGTPFSLASSPTEEVLKFATVIRDGSPLKEEMDAKEPGDHFIVSGPYGEFIYEEKGKKIGLIAGGIGVTPFIGILQYLTDNGLDTRATLLYSCKTPQSTAFKEELAELSARNNNIEVVYTMTEDPSYEGHRGRIDRKFVRTHVPDYEERTWYAAGPPSLVQSINRMLRGQLLLRDIKLEVFSGY
jgi:ferredoxin-NADP reductase